jgi:hypothetical protein
VKAVLGSGASVISSSAGFYIDDTLPEFDPEVHFYIDVYQGPATPVEYQGSNNTIKAVWLCADESQITVSTRARPLSLRPCTDERESTYCKSSRQVLLLK